MKHRTVDEIRDLISKVPIEEENITEDHTKQAKVVLLDAMKDIKPFLNKSDELKKLTRSLRIYSAIAEEVSPEKVRASREVLEKIDSTFGEL